METREEVTDEQSAFWNVDPEAVLKLVNKAEVSDIGREVRTLLQKVCASLNA